jgi:hypothetical protein
VRKAISNAWSQSLLLEHDEKLAFHIRSFHSSTLQSLEFYSPSAERFTFPLDLAGTQKGIGTSVGHQKLVR